MKRRLKYPTLLSAACLALWALSGCPGMTESATPTRTTTRPATLAVWDLENLNPSELKGFNLGELLAARAMQSFEASNQWLLVEREDLLLALEEQNLGTTAMVSDDTRLQIGKLLGAGAMVFGSYMKFGQTLQLNLRIVDVATGQILRATEKTAPYKSVGEALDMVEAAVHELQN